jgi:hypothetical protein
LRRWIEKSRETINDHPPYKRKLLKIHRCLAHRKPPELRFPAWAASRRSQSIRMKPSKAIRSNPPVAGDS